MVVTCDLNSEPGWRTYPIFIQHNFHSAYATYRLLQPDTAVSDVLQPSAEDIQVGRHEPELTTYKTHGEHEDCHTIGIPYTLI